MSTEGLWSLALALAAGCSGPPPVERVNHCSPPLAFEWVGGVHEAAFEQVPNCEDIAFLRGADGGLVLEVEGVASGVTRAPDAVAFRDVEGVGWIGADWQRRFVLRAPGAHEEVLIGEAPRDALQWGLSGVHLGPDGWWVVTWASWIGDHRELRPSVTRVFFVSRETLQAVPVAWPELEPTRLSMQPRRSGLDVMLEDGRTFEVRWRPGCQPEAADLVTPPPRCATWAAEAPMCFGRC